jgi:uncharacterized protein YdeI (YjbR/CyaY-like superfamily)
METYKNTITYHAKTRQDWRNWLVKNHDSEKSVWLIIYKKESGIASVYYPEAVDEALCFGWIDSLPNKPNLCIRRQSMSRTNCIIPFIIVK